MLTTKRIILEYQKGPYSSSILETRTDLIFTFVDRAKTIPTEQRLERQREREKGLKENILDLFPEFQLKVLSGYGRNDPERGMIRSEKYGLIESFLRTLGDRIIDSQIK